MIVLLTMQPEASIATVRTQDGSILTTPVMSRLRKKMLGRIDQFFYAEIVDDRVKVYNYAPYQTWM